MLGGYLIENRAPAICFTRQSVNVSATMSRWSPLWGVPQLIIGKKRFWSVDYKGVILVECSS